MTQTPVETLATLDPVNNLETLERVVRISLWWIRNERWEQPHRFLFGDIVPARKRPGSTAAWASSDVAEKSFDNAEQGSSIRRIVRRHITVPGHLAHAFLMAVHAGKTLAEASVALGSDLDIGSEHPLMDQKWTRLSPVFFSTTPPSGFLQPFAQGRRSLANDAGCYCTRFCPPNRFGFLGDEPKSDEVLRWVAKELEEETGVSFSGSGADAFGCLEVYEFPSLDENGRCLVEVQYDRGEGRSIQAATLTIRDPEPSAHYLAQVRTEVLQDISSDQVVVLDPATKQATVAVPEPVDGVLVRVWKKGPTGAWILWHEQEHHFVREMHMRMSIVGLSGAVRAPWLSKLGSSRASSRAEAFSRISQVSMELPSVTSTRTAWEKGIQSAREGARRVHPAASEGRFFPKGWEGDSKLSMAEWLKVQLSDHSGSIILMDPYFDVIGVDLLVRSSGAAKELLVLTSTQVSSDDDKEGQPTRRERLVAVCNELLPVLRGLQLQIRDLRSTGGGSKQLFHDRYLLFYDENGGIEKGFNLSTSLQSAATPRSPLLVTPIPRDVLDDVVDYVSSLLDPKGTGLDAELVTLFPDGSKKRVPRGLKVSSRRATAVLRTMEVAQAKTDLVAPDSVERLRELGHLDESDGQKIRLDLTPEQLGIVKQYLITAPLPESAVVWEGLIEAALRDWRDEEVPTFLNTLCQDRTAPMAHFLVQYLLGHVQRKLQAEDANEHVRTLAHVFGRQFPEAVNKAADLFEYHHEFPLGTSWSIHCALLCLTQFFPNQLDGLVDELLSLEQKSDAILSALATALTTIAQRGRSLDHLARSRHAFMRALAAVAKLHAAQEDESRWDEFEQHLQHYPESERQEVLGRALYELRIQGNQAESRGEKDKPQPLRSRVNKALLASFASDVSVARLVELMPRFSGPRLGNWSMTTHTEILAPLIEQGLLTGEQTFAVWNAILDKRRVDEHFSRFDADVVQVWGSTFWGATQEQKTAILTRLRKDIRRAEGMLSEPFLQSRDHERWYSAANTTLWSMLQTWAILHFRRPESDTADFVSLAGDIIRVIDSDDLVASALGDMKPASDQLLERLRELVANADKL